MKNINFEKYPLPDRTRHHTSPNFYFPASELKIIPKHYPPLYENINWNEVFLNGKPPQAIDIGCGRGLFLLTIAEEAADENILGLEVRDWCCQWLDNYIKSEKIENCAVLRYSVANGLQFISKESIKEIYYLFPDPWTKTKHVRRRAFTISFLEEIHRVLIPGGKLYLATDLEEIDKYHKKTLTKFGKLFWNEIDNSSEWGKPATNKELFCQRENIKTYKIIAVKN